MEERKNRIDSGVPKTAETDKLSEKEKKQLELSGEIEHQHGERREKTAEEAEDLDEKNPKPES